MSYISLEKLYRLLGESPGIGIQLRRIRRSYHTLRHKPHRIDNVAMLHAGRCGSSVLADLLDQHSLMRWSNEPFESMGPAYSKMDPQNRAHHLLADLLFFHKSAYFGFDSKYLPEQHLDRGYANKSILEYIELLKSLGFNRFILLNRQNHLRRAISTSIGHVTGLWNSAKAPSRPTSVTLSIDKFVSYGIEMPLLDFFASLDKAYAELAALLQGSSIIELTYEDDIEPDPRIAYDKTCGFLGIEAEPVAVRLAKQNTRSIEELIDNYQEVATLLSGTKYEWMLSG